MQGRAGKMKGLVPNPKIGPTGLEKWNDNNMYIIAINQEWYIFNPWLDNLFLNSIIVLVLFEIKSLMISTILVHCDKPTILSQESYLNFTEISLIYREIIVMKKKFCIPKNREKT